MDPQCKSGSHKIRWFQFRLSTLLVGVLGICAALGWWWQMQKTVQQSSEIERLRVQVAQLRAKDILRADIADEEKAVALATYVKPGDWWRDVRARLGPASGVGTHGPGFAQRDYDVGLVVATYPDGEVYGVGYYAPVDGKRRRLVWLSVDDLVTWPKTVRIVKDKSDRRPSPANLE